MCECVCEVEGFPINNEASFVSDFTVACPPPYLLQPVPPHNLQFVPIVAAVSKVSPATLFTAVNSLTS